MRRSQLQTMHDECKNVEEMSNEFANRMSDIEQKVEALPEVSFGSDTLKKQKSEYKVNIYCTLLIIYFS